MEINGTEIKTMETGFVRYETYAMIDLIFYLETSKGKM